MPPPGNTQPIGVAGTVDDNVPHGVCNMPDSTSDVLNRFGREVPRRIVLGLGLRLGLGIGLGLVEIFT